MTRVEDVKVINLKSRKFKKKYRKLYDIFESIKSYFCTKKKDETPKNSQYKRHVNN